MANSTVQVHDTLAWRLLGSHCQALTTTQLTVSHDSQNMVNHTAPLTLGKMTT
jgi:hypothetical protein